MTGEDVSCETCVAACCRSSRLQFSNKEFKQYGASMGVEVVVKPTKTGRRVPDPDRPDGFLYLPPNEGLYLLQGACGNLAADNRCSIHPTRPQACRDFKVGSPECLRARKRAGLDDEALAASSESAPTTDGAQQLLREFFPSTGTTAPNREATSVARLPARALCAEIDREGGWISQTIARCGTDDWGRRSRCGTWTVGDVAAHAVTVQELAIRLLEAAASGGGATSPPSFTGPKDATAAALADRHRVLSTAARSLSETRLATRVVLDDEGSVEVQYLLEMTALELAVHALDIADSLGTPHHLTAEQVQVIARLLPDVLDAAGKPPARASYLLRSVAFAIPFAWRDGRWRNERGEQACWIDGDPETVLLFALGRVTLDNASLTTNDANQARAFKRYLAGP